MSQPVQSPPPEPKDVYLCYNSADAYWVRNLAEHLESETIDGLPGSRRLRVFLDQWDIDSGESLIQRMNEGMKHSRFVVTVLSPEFMKAPWPTFEWTHIVSEDPMNVQKRLIPVRVRDVTLDGKERIDFCAPFRGLKYIDFRRKDDIHENVPCLGAPHPWAGPRARRDAPTTGQRRASRRQRRHGRIVAA